MQHPPTKLYQDSSDCEKRGCLLVTVVQIHSLPSKASAFVLDFAIEGPLASNRPCLFLRGVFFLSSQQSTYNASNYSIALTAATSSDLDFLVMQHLPTKAYQNSSDCEKRGCLLVTVVQLTPCLGRPLHLPSKGVCHRWAFAIEVRFALKGHCHRRTFIIDAPLPCKGL
jgi:hypothetical protein